MASAEEVAAQEAAAAEAEANEAAKKLEIDGEVFDPERAMKTIRTQREAEKELKAELAKYREAEEAEAEKKKSLETKVTERDQRISELEGTLTELAVRGDFERAALEAGFDQDDLVLAYMAAKEEGFLGEFDPKTGKSIITTSRS